MLKLEKWADIVKDWLWTLSKICSVRKIEKRVPKFVFEAQKLIMNFVQKVFQLSALRKLVRRS